MDVYEINGPFFFGLASRFEEFEDKRRNVKVRIIRMRKVPFIDSTGINNLKNLIDRSHRRGIKVILSGVNDQVRNSLLSFGIDKLVPESSIQPHITPALQKARELLKQ